MKSFLLFTIAIYLITITACEYKSNKKNAPNDDEGIVEMRIPTHMFIGGYSRDEGWVNGIAEGIYRLSFGVDGTLSIDETAAEVINPSFLVLSPDQKNLYTVSELGRENEPTGFVHAFTINENLSLSFIAKYPTNAQAPAHISVDRTGKFVFVANYQGGVVMVYERNDDGSLSVLQQLDFPGSTPHTHMVKVSPDNNYLFIPDLGNDKIWSYKIDHSSKTLSKTNQEFGITTSGAGPRHIDFHPNLNIAYVINELNSTISVFDYEPETGSLTKKQVIKTLPDSYTDWNRTADIHVHPNGKFLYASNRGHNSIVSYTISESSGTLTFLAHTPTEGAIPRNFAITLTGDALYIANQNSGSITSFELSTETGKLTFTGNKLSVGTPTSIAFFYE